ncbi:hypothetical protein CU098_005943 [Rhizopus stolonifer]|uniref:Kinase n=1 Tax=Rhizopus stolonifer TaxID=4846 RepID=A0A367JAY1_RHIST|nr:hypothetical protein CU098_005943 [Rhizopus stolonifer]
MKAKCHTPTSLKTKVNSDWESESNSSSENDDNQEHKDHYFDPTKITTSLPLLPFKNQVGGHASFFRFSKRAICKPVSQSEQDFYEHIDTGHHELLPFTSQYIGVLNVTYRLLVPEVMFEKNQHLLRDWEKCHSRGGCKKRRHSAQWDCRRRFQEKVLREVFSAKAIRERLLQAQDWQRTFGDHQGRSLPNLSGLDQTVDQIVIEARRPSLINSTSSLPQLLQYEKEKPMFSMDDIAIEKKLAEQSAPPIEKEQSETSNNPWSLQMYNRDLQRIKNRKQTSEQKYILIEDLTDGIKYPCVLDLKMGTRQYGVYASEEKMNGQKIKCEKSTSKLLGVRVCGMQVYQTDVDEFSYQDKYFGRNLSPYTFRKTLQNYLDNGKGCEIQHIPVIVRKLRRLARIVKTMHGYRFYASSLLIIYDGDPLSVRKVDVRIIDFANCITIKDLKYNHKKFTYPPTNKGPDSGYLLGLKTLTLCYEWIYLTQGGLPENIVLEGEDVFHDISDPANDKALAKLLH